jgi:flagellar export protein FliJ
MNAFHFRLERVLRWRSTEVAAEEAKLKNLISENAQLLSLLDTLVAEKKNVPHSIAALQDLCGADLNCAASYAARCELDHNKTAQKQAAKQNELAAQVSAYRSARKKHDLLEELRKRRLTEWRYESGRELDAIAEESFVSRWRGPSTS